MRIYDQDNDKTISNVMLCLTKGEAIELMDSLKNILKINDGHEHISDEEYSHELTIFIYDMKMVESYDDRVRKVIIDDK